jgi:hypothetical protein
VIVGVLLGTKSTISVHRPDVIVIHELLLIRLPGVTGAEKNVFHGIKVSDIGVIHEDVEIPFVEFMISKVLFRGERILKGLTYCRTGNDEGDDDDEGFHCLMFLFIDLFDKRVPYYHYPFFLLHRPKERNKERSSAGRTFYPLVF